jgi:hypothetical protein
MFGKWPLKVETVETQHSEAGPLKDRGLLNSKTCEAIAGPFKDRGLPTST